VGGNVRTAVVKGAVKELRSMETCKKLENRYQLCLFLCNKNVDLKNNSGNYKKNILNFLGARIAGINLFQYDLDTL